MESVGLLQACLFSALSILDGDKVLCWVHHLGQVCRGWAVGRHLHHTQGNQDTHRATSVLLHQKSRETDSVLVQRASEEFSHSCVYMDELQAVMKVLDSSGRSVLSHKLKSSISQVQEVDGKLWWLSGVPVHCCVLSVRSATDSLHVKIPELSLFPSHCLLSNHFHG